MITAAGVGKTRDKNNATAGVNNQGVSVNLGLTTEQNTIRAGTGTREGVGEPRLAVNETLIGKLNLTLGAVASARVTAASLGSPSKAASMISCHRAMLCRLSHCASNASRARRRRLVIPGARGSRRWAA